MIDGKFINVWYSPQHPFLNPFYRKPEEVASQILLEIKEYLGVPDDYPLEVGHDIMDDIDSREGSLGAVDMICKIKRGVVVLVSVKQHDL